MFSSHQGCDEKSETFTYFEKNILVVDQYSILVIYLYFNIKNIVFFFRSSDDVLVREQDDDDDDDTRLGESNKLHQAKVSVLRKST